LREFLAAYGVGLHDIPCVLQLNRLSSGHLSSACLTVAELEVPDMPSCLCEAGSGEGLLEVLSLLSREIMARIGTCDALRSPVVVELSKGSGASDSVTPPVPPCTDQVLMPSCSARSLEEETDVHAVLSKEDGSEELQVSLAREGAESSNGVVRIPLELTLRGATRRMVVSIAIDQE
jgi:hypothetical protein